MKNLNVDLLSGFGFDPDWSIEDAYAAGAEGRTSPFFRWCAWERLAELKERFSAGDSHSLLSALYTCAQHDLPMPDWVAMAFSKKYTKWCNYEYKTLDDAFETALPKGAHINSLRKRKRLKLLIPLEVEELKKKGMATDKAIFEMVSKNIPAGYATSPSDVEKIYYGYHAKKKKRQGKKEDEKKLSKI